MPEFNRELDATNTFRIHLLDVGPEQYGDCVLCQFGNITVLIDGAHPTNKAPRDGHPSIPDQIGKLLNQNPPYRVSLLIVSHAHQDHIGCLPFLIKNDIVRTKWALLTDPKFGWGRATDDDRAADANLDINVRQLAAGFREEPLTRASDEVMTQFLSDAAGLESTYNEMIDRLEQAGTKVIRHGRDDLNPLQNAFLSVGLRVLGPTADHVLECADLIQQLGRDAIDTASDMLASDAAATPSSAYRDFIRQAMDSADASKFSLGAAINLQSNVVRFKFRGRTFLFGGDMQFSAPGVDSEFLDKSVKALRNIVKDEAPFTFVKLCHHGSNNAFSEEILGELGGTKLFGICAGEGSTHHPNPKVLNILNNHRQDITWARTDHNGQVTFSFEGPKPTIIKTKGRLNDEVPNASDVAGPVTRPAAEQPATSPAETRAQVVIAGPSPETPGIVEVVAKIPHVSTRVTITIDVEPRALPQPSAAIPRPPEPQPGLLGPQPGPDRGVRLPPLRIAAGRNLPDLLFVTSKQALADNLGQAEAAHVLETLHAANKLVFDEVPRGLTESAEAIALVINQLQEHSEVEGVVLVGGHDVVPSQIIDCLPQTIRQRLSRTRDLDNFIVWSDDAYGDRDGDGLPELPVSRIPDGKSAQLVFAAIQAGNITGSASRAGVRNIVRPFAELIYETLPGTAPILVSKPTVFDQQPPIGLGADKVYFMLHGSDTDSSRFLGEDPPGEYLEAVNVGNIPAQARSVIFAGCCWGALTIATKASLAERNRAYGQKAPGESIAMTFLSRGATAFVGCTGAHYSPMDEPFGYFGGPMHQAFWANIQRGAPPAKALFDAKIQYIAGMPHGRTQLADIAVEHKILRQYTCLGLGW